MEKEKDTDQDKAKQLLKHFDNVFGTNTIENVDYYFSKIKMLKNIYEILEEDLCSSNPEYKGLRNQHIEVTDMLDNSFSKAQQTLFEKHLDIGCEMVSVECEQMFYFGYILAKILDQDFPIKKIENK